MTQCAQQTTRKRVRLWMGTLSTKHTQTHTETHADTRTLTRAPGASHKCLAAGAPRVGAQGVPLQHPCGVLRRTRTVPSRDARQPPQPCRTSWRQRMADVGDGAAGWSTAWPWADAHIKHSHRWRTESMSAGARRLHRSAERHRRGPRRGAAARLRAVMAMFRGNYHRTVSTKVEGHGRRGNRGMASASGSIAGEDAAPRMAQLGPSRRAASPRRLRAASAPPSRLRGSGRGAGDGPCVPRGMPSASGSIAGDDAAPRMAQLGARAWIHTSTPTSSQGRRRGRSRSQDDVMVAPYECYP